MSRKQKKPLKLEQGARVFPVTVNGEPERYRKERG